MHQGLKLIAIAVTANACLTGSASAGLFDGFGSPKVNAAQNRCLTYGFRDPNKLARCTELEVNFHSPKSWSLKQLNKAGDACLLFGYSGDKLAACVQRQLRGAF